MPHRMRDGVRLVYAEAGTGGPPLVLVHGWCCDHTYLAPQVAHFRPHHRVVALDLRGYGQSDAPAQAHTIPGFADDVAWLCGELGLVRPVLVGHSPTDPPAVKAKFLAGVAAACRVPALAVASAHPITDLTHLRQLIPQLVTGQTVGSGHFIPLIEPAQVNAMLDRFLATNLSSNEPGNRPSMRPPPPYLAGGCDA